LVMMGHAVAGTLGSVVGMGAVCGTGLLLNSP